MQKIWPGEICMNHQNGIEFTVCYQSLFRTQIVQKFLYVTFCIGHFIIEFKRNTESTQITSQLWEQSVANCFIVKLRLKYDIKNTQFLNLLHNVVLKVMTSKPESIICQFRWKIDHFAEGPSARLRCLTVLFNIVQPAKDFYKNFALT